MKMQNVDIEIIEFDTLDVIATSGGGGNVDDTTVEVIWMTPQSVSYFNALYNDDMNLRLAPTKIRNDVIWYAYGVYDEDDEGNPRWGYKDYLLSGSSDPTVGIRTVRENNAADYKNVLDWLKQKNGM